MRTVLTYLLMTAFSACYAIDNYLMNYNTTICFEEEDELVELNDTISNLLEYTTHDGTARITVFTPRIDREMIKAIQREENSATLNSVLMMFNSSLSLINATKGYSSNIASIDNSRLQYEIRNSEIRVNELLETKSYVTIQNISNNELMINNMSTGNCWYLRPGACFTTVTENPSENSFRISPAEVNHPKYFTVRTNSKPFKVETINYSSRIFVGKIESPDKDKSKTVYYFEDRKYGKLFKFGHNDYLNYSKDNFQQFLKENNLL